MRLSKLKIVDNWPSNMQSDFRAYTLAYTLFHYFYLELNSCCIINKITFDALVVEYDACVCEYFANYELTVEAICTRLEKLIRNYNSRYLLENLLENILIGIRYDTNYWNYNKFLEEMHDIGQSLANYFYLQGGHPINLDPNCTLNLKCIRSDHLLHVSIKEKSKGNYSGIKSDVL